MKEYVQRMYIGKMRKSDTDIVFTIGRRRYRIYHNTPLWLILQVIGVSITIGYMYAMYIILWVLMG